MIKSLRKVQKMGKKWNKLEKRVNHLVRCIMSVHFIMSTMSILSGFCDAVRLPIEPVTIVVNS